MEKWNKRIAKRKMHSILYISGGARISGFLGIYVDKYIYLEVRTLRRAWWLNTVELQRASEPIRRSRRGKQT
jgi:hypothetical protein